MTTRRPLGVWCRIGATLDHDDLLGRRSGVFHGTVTLFVAAARLIPPNGNPIGPMSLEVSCVIA